MDSQLTCDRIQEQLEAFTAGTLPDEVFLKLMDHVDRCPDCAMLLRLHQHTSAVPTEELEARVPDHLVDGMYGRVMEEIRVKARKQEGFSVRWPVFRWLVPVLSSAVAVLLVGGGLVFHELRQLQQREEILSDRIERQERFLRDGGIRTASPVGIRDRLALSSDNRTRVLARQEDASIAQLQSLLERLPSSTLILDPEETATLFARYDRWTSTAAWEEAIADIDVRDGLQADEMIRMIRALDPDPETRIPTARLISLSQRSAPRSRLLSD